MNRNLWVGLVALAILVGVVFLVVKKKPGSDGGGAPTGEISGAEDGTPAAEGTGPSTTAPKEPGGSGPDGKTAPTGEATGSGGSAGSAAPTSAGTGAAPSGSAGADGNSGAPTSAGAGKGAGTSTGDSATVAPGAAAGSGGVAIPNRPEAVAGGGKPPTAEGVPPDVDPKMLGAGGGTVVAKRPLPDGVDGHVAQPGDDGDLPPPSKTAPVSAPSLAGVKDARVWLVASDLRKAKGAPKGGAPFEVGVSEGGKATPWGNRAGSKYGDGVRVKGGSTATFVKGLATSTGAWDAVALCAPGARECVNAQASQIRFGLDVNHAEHWLSGADRSGKSRQGGGSFTVLFVAARASAAGNPLLEHQNGEAGASRGPFLGWIGKDLVGSIHGTQGVVGMSAVALPSPYAGESATPPIPRIYSMRFDRKKSELRVYQLGAAGSEVATQAIAAGDGPDNDQYATIALGSKNPGAGSATYVFEAAAFPRALSDGDVCAIHREWNKKYALKIAEIKPCK